MGHPPGTLNIAAQADKMPQQSTLAWLETVAHNGHN